MAWDDAKKAKAIEMYLEGEPTPENSMDIVGEIAEELGETVNGVRMILSKAKREDGETAVYVKKDPSKPSASRAAAKPAGGGTARVGKEDAQKALIAAVEAHGQTADEEIVSKMTGKAAQHFTALFNAITTS